MSSNEYTFTDKDGDQVHVETGYGTTDPSAFVITRGDAGAYVPQSEAPAFALAILKAAGIEPGGYTSLPAMAADYLERHIERQAREAALDELDDEALALFKAAAPERAGLSKLPIEYADHWRALARAARKLHGKES